MRVSVDRDDVMALAKFVPANQATVRDVSFHGGDKISVTGDFKLPIDSNAGIGAKILSFINDKTPSKTITVSISALENPERIKIALDKLGLKYFGFANKLVPMLVDMFGGLLKKKCDIDDIPEGVDWNGKSVTLEYNKILEEKGVKLRVNEIECRGGTLRLAFCVANRESEHCKGSLED